MKSFKQFIKESKIEENLTVREIRQKLFKIDSKEADALRKELFDIDDQDSKASKDVLDKYHKIAGVKEEKDVDVKLDENQLEEYDAFIASFDERKAATAIERALKSSLGLDAQVTTKLESQRAELGVFSKEFKITPSIFKSGRLRTDLGVNIRSGVSFKGVLDFDLVLLSGSTTNHRVGDIEIDRDYKVTITLAK